MKYIKLLILILLLVFTTGCVSYSELNELGIVDMILIDKDNNQYVVSLNMLTPTEDDLKSNKVYTTSDKSLDKCLTNLYLESNKKISFSHLELILFTTNLEKDDYDEVINLFLNRSDSRNTFSTVITNPKTNLENYRKDDINNLINVNHENEGIVAIKQFDDVVKDILEIKNSYIPKIDDKDSIKIDGYYSIYNENKLLTKDESIGYNFITDNIIKNEFEVNDINFKINYSKTNLKINRNKININITTTYQIMSNNTKIKDDKELDLLFQEGVKKYINSYLALDNYNYFSNLLKKYDYKYYKNNKDITFKFSIKISSNKINNSNIKGDDSYE